MNDSKQAAAFLPLSQENVAAAPLLHACDLPVRWGDLDAFQHVNNTIYFRFMEQCRIEWFGLLGAALSDTDQVPNLVGAECRFLRAILYPATVRVTIRLGRWNEKVVQTFHEIWNGETLAAIGDCRLLWMSIEEQRSVPLPAAVRARLDDIMASCRG